MHRPFLTRTLLATLSAMFLLATSVLATPGELPDEDPPGGGPTEPPVLCGAAAPPESVRAAVRAAISAQLQTFGVYTGPPRTIRVAFHIITAPNYQAAWDSGTVSTTQLDHQIAVLDSAFAGLRSSLPHHDSGFRFMRYSVDNVCSRPWWCLGQGSIEEVSAKLALARDPTHILNVYVVRGPSLDVYHNPLPGPMWRPFAWSDFPFSYPEGSYLDGVVIPYTSLLPDNAIGSQLGKWMHGISLVHEVGHYLGVYHTFDPQPNGCLGNGDEVDDTPPEQLPHYDCSSGCVSSCIQGLCDPVLNYMDYTTDPCRVEFTPGQIQRMQLMVDTFRPHLFDAISTGMQSTAAAVGGAVRPSAPRAVPEACVMEWQAMGDPLPDARTGAAVVATDLGLLVFGGTDPARDISSMFLDDVWLLPTSGAAHWQHLQPTGVGPAGRAYSAAVWDSVESRLIVFGGQARGGPTNDVWELRATAFETGHWQWSWQQRNIAGAAPVPRYATTCIIDKQRNVMVMYGGRDASTDMGDVWALNLSGATDWTQYSLSGDIVPWRHAHCAVYDDAGDQMIMQGGECFGAMLGTTWKLSLGVPHVWSHVDAGTIPPTVYRLGQVGSWDAVTHQLLIFGGTTSDGVKHDDTWALNLVGVPGWQCLSVNGVLRPRARTSGGGAWLQGKRELFVYGGLGGGGGGVDTALVDTWRGSIGDSVTWVPYALPYSPPPGLAGQSVIYDAGNDRLVMYGGFRLVSLGNGDVVGRFSDTVWVCPMAGTAGWTQLPTSGTGPGSRWAHAAVYDPGAGGRAPRMIVIGGEDTTHSAGQYDMWALSLTGAPTWSAVSYVGAGGSVPWVFPSVVYDGVYDRLLLYGGEDAFHYRGIYEYSMTGGYWVWRGNSVPPNRAMAAVGYDAEERLLSIHGGIAWQYGSTPQVLSDWLTAHVETQSDMEWSSRQDSVTSYRYGCASAASGSELVELDGGEGARSGQLLYFGGGGFATHELVAGPGDGRVLGASVFVPTRARWLVVGGRLASVGGGPARFTDEMWELRLSCPGPFSMEAKVKVARASWDVGDRAELMIGVEGRSASGGIRIAFDSRAGGACEAAVYDISGRRVATLMHGFVQAGPHTVVWNTRGTGGVAVSSGVYFCRVSVGSRAGATKFVVVR